MKKLLICSALIVSATFVFADEEAANRIYVTAAPSGQFYAKSYPAKPFGLEGRTEVYQVGEKDVLVQTYDWYSPGVYVEGWIGPKTVYVVQLGPWQRGHEASKDHLALAFYKNDKLLKRYSTLDIARSPTNVSTSVSHYSVLGKITGFVWPFITNTLYFEAETQDKKPLVFDADTGLIVTPEERRLAEELDGAKNRIGSLKIDWMMKNKAQYDADKNIKITQPMMETLSPGQFPKLPAGYRYIPGPVWERAELKHE
jgi:hypothetical protein